MSSLSNAAIVSQILSVALKPVMPRGFVCLPCDGCQNSLCVREGTPVPVFCSACRRANAEAAAYQAVRDIEDLIRGRGVFAILTKEERAEQLRQFGITIEPHSNEADAPTAEERDEIESRIELEAIEEYEDERWDGME